MPRAAVVALAHGGGPMPILGDPAHDEIVSSLKNRVPEILRLNGPDKPRAIVLCTAHWSERQPTISSAPKHKLLYDYYGFPAKAYKLKYDAPGSPEVAMEVARAMREEGLTPAFDEERGWDHGVFVPLSLARPEADIPIVQLSVLESEDASQHFAMGRALGKLRENNVAVIGSGFASFHNLRAMMSGKWAKPDFKGRNDAWSKAVTDAALEPNTEMRESLFEDWRQWPHAFEMHPKGAAEHFLPLIVAAGAGGDDKAKYYKDHFTGVGDSYSYYWE